jgi:DNA-binding transcriptional regulator YiaG
MKPLKRSGSEIMAWRTGLGRSRRWLADQLGVSPKTVESWEYEARNPSGPALLLIEQLIASNHTASSGEKKP